MHDESERRAPSAGRAAETASRPPFVYSLPPSLLVGVLILLVAVVVSAMPDAGAAADPSRAGVRVEAAVPTGMRPPPSTPSPPPVADPSVAARTSGGEPPTLIPPTAAQQATERADLAAEAARLTAPVALTAPTDWARWGSVTPNYAADVDGCPHLAARLTATLGARMSYWQGTLPEGPYGCSWVPTPLTDDPSGHPYVLNVGWLADGTTTDELRTGFSERGGATCPGVEVPAVGAGAVLVRCEQPTDVEYSLVLRNAIGPGVWLLHARAGTDARHSAGQALAALVDAVERAYR